MSIGEAVTRGRALLAGGDLVGAQQLGRALLAEGNQTAGWLVLADLAGTLGEPAERLRCLRQAAAGAPDDAGVLNELATAMMQQGDHAGAIPLFRHAIAVNPPIPALYNNLGNAQRFAGPDPAEALDAYERALAIDPSLLHPLESALTIASEICDLERAAALQQQLEAAVRGPRFAGQLDVLINLLYLDVTRPLAPDVRGRVAQALAALLAGVPTASGPAAPNLSGRLRIGYLSPNFGDHPVGHVIGGVLAGHDPDRIELHLFSQRDRSGETAPYHRWLRAAAAAWHDLHGLTPAAQAARIRAAGIDVLVDLNGLMSHDNLVVLAARPAPIQVFWLGHAGGLDMPFVDYLIADAVVLPPGAEVGYAERIVRLPTYHCATPHAIAAVAPDRASCGLPAEGFVFCGFNNPQKIDAATLDRWARVLRAVEGSVLWLSNIHGRPSVAASLRRAARDRGLDPDRLVFADRTADKAVHLARHVHAGLLLDTGSLNASTTALDALWAGVPVLTLPGARFGQRIAATFLKRLGLDELIVADEAAYVATAAALAGDPARLAALRARLAAACRSGPLFDGRHVARWLEAAYGAMTDRRRLGQPPGAFTVQEG